MDARIGRPHWFRFWMVIHLLVLAPPAKADPVAAARGIAQEGVHRAMNSGEIAEALKKQQRLVELTLDAYGPDHWRSLTRQRQLAELQMASQQFEAARELRERILRHTRRTFGANHWRTRTAIHLSRQAATIAELPIEAQQQYSESQRCFWQASGLALEGKLDAALDRAHQALQLREKACPKQSPWNSTFAEIHFLLANLLGHQQLYAKALEQVELGLSELGPDSSHPVLVEAHYLRSSLALGRGDARTAQEAINEAVRFGRELFSDAPPNSISYADALRMKARMQIMARRFRQAATLLEQSRAVMESLFSLEEFPQGHLTHAVTLEAFAYLATRESDHAQAKQHYEDALTMLRRLEPTPAVLTSQARTLRNLSANAIRHNDFARAESALLEEQSINETVYRDNNVELRIAQASTFKELSHLHLKTNDTARALQLAKQSYALTEGSRDRRTKSVRADGLMLLAQIHNIRREYRDSIENLESALRILTALEGDVHPNVARCHNQLGIAFWTLDEQELAFQHFRDAVQTYELLHGETTIHSDELATTLQNLGLIYLSRNEVTQAAATLQSACKVSVQPRTTARILMSVGSIRFRQGLYDQAAESFLNSIAILDNAADSADRSLDYIARVNLANALCRAGRVQDAKRHIETMLDLPLEGNNVSALVSAVLTSAFTYEAIGEFKRADDAYESAIELCNRTYDSQTFPNGHPLMSKVLHNHGCFLMMFGDEAAGIEKLEKALRTRMHFRSLKNPQADTDLAETLHALAYFSFKTGNDDKGREYATQIKYQGQKRNTDLALMMSTQTKLVSGELSDALSNLSDVERRLSGENGGFHLASPTFARLTVTMTALMAATQNYSGALAVSRRSNELMTGMADQFLPFVSESEALNFMANQRQLTDQLLSLTRLTETAPDEYFDLLWAQKGAIHHSVWKRQQQLAKILADKDHSGVREQHLHWIDVRREIARLTLSPAAIDQTARADRRKRLQQLGEEKESLERQIADQLNDESADEPIRWQQIRRQLRPGEVLVDIRSYLRDPFSIESLSLDHRPPLVRHYTVFVLVTDQPVHRVELGAAKGLDSLIGKWRETIGAGHAEQVKTLGQELRSRVWDRIEAVIPPETDTILLCPDGRFANLPWSAMPGDAGQGVLLERYAFCHLPYPQFLLQRTTHQPAVDAGESAARGMLLVGDVDYDAIEDSEQRRVPHDHELTTSRDGQPLRWHRLEHTRTETEGIRQLVADRHPMLAVDGATATVERVLQALPRVTRAHFATHGFFADPRFRSALQVDPALFEERLLYSQERTTIGGRNPLTLCGIVLAGANLSSSDGGSTGLFTGELIAGMPLQHLDLVTLSACESGIGDVAGGEGVYGLQRAFHVAGTRSVVSSLWKVDDRATEQLMLAFYRNLYRKKMSKLQALRTAQLSVFYGTDVTSTSRGLIREPIGSVEAVRGAPRLWAGWVLSGAQE